MGKKVFSLFVITLCVIIGIMAFESSPRRPHNFEPIMISRTDLEASFEVTTAREIENPGKLWVYNNFILLVEQYRGIHIINNSNPNNPQRIGFVNIIGCTELAARDGILYANNAIDLIGVKATQDFSSLEVVSRNRNVLPMISSPEHWNDDYFINKLPENMIIIRWEPIDD